MIANAVSHQRMHLRQRPDETHGLNEPPLRSRNAAEGGKGQHVPLTPRQLEVLALLCQGLPNKLICRRLSIAAGTAKSHISSILRELGVSSRLQAVVEAGRRGLLGDRCDESPGARTPVRRQATHW